MKKVSAILVPFVAMILRLDVVFSGNNNFYKLSRIQRDRYGEALYHVSNRYRDVFLRESDLDNLCYSYVIERSEYENSYGIDDTKISQNPLTRVNNGLKIVIGNIKRFFRSLVQSAKNYIIVTFGGCFDGRSILTSGCWILPTTLFATGLLARDEICDISNNNFVGCTVTNSSATTTTTEGPCVPTTPVTNPTPLTCTCINFVSPNGDGNCLTASPSPTHCDLRFCYVAPATNTCLDTVESTTIPGLFYSAQACL